ncbi:MAG: DinB family protein [Acidobacteriales bacterium]|nr:DinB family protein [Terriglobales bacterium]
MSEGKRIAELMRQAYEGLDGKDAWHGKSLRNILRGITAEQAAKKLPGSKHTIWELVVHIANWDEISVRRLAGEKVEFALDSPGDWPEVSDQSEASWQATQQRLESAQSALRNAVAACSDAKLAEKAVNRDFTNYTALHGILHHDIHHAGQIALMKRMLQTPS